MNLNFHGILFCSMNASEKTNKDNSQTTDHDPILSSNNESHGSFQSEQFKALALMKDNLPEYVIESFVEAGFDTLDVISQIDTTGIEEIEQFITREFVDDVRFKQGFRVTGEFLPGHRRQINNFIVKVNEEINSYSKKLKFRQKSKRTSTTTEAQSSATNSKRKKIDHGLHSSLNSMSESINSVDDVVPSFIRPENQANIMAKIRQQIVKWQRQHNTDRVARLKETVHFDVKVDVGKDNLSLSVICNICGKRCILSSSNKHIFLSN